MNKWKFRPEHSETMKSTPAVSPESIPEVSPEQEYIRKTADQSQFRIGSVCRGQLYGPCFHERSDFG
jgi:hypothetical protein